MSSGNRTAADCLTDGELNHDAKMHKAVKLEKNNDTMKDSVKVVRK